MEKNFRSLFDMQTGQYMGITRERPWPENSTNVTPHFAEDYKTIFDRDFNHWHLVREIDFLNQMSVKDKLKEQDLFCMVKIQELAAAIKSSFENNLQLSQYNEKCNIDRFVNLRNSIGNLSLLIQAESTKTRNEVQSVFHLVARHDQMAHQQNLQMFDLMELAKATYIRSKKSYWTSRFIDWAVDWYRAILRAHS